jgi:hypothetical protein
MFLIFVVILVDGTFCVSFMYPILCWWSCTETGSSSINWDQLSMLLPEDGDRVLCPKLVFYIKTSIIGNFYNNCNTVKNSTIYWF